MCPRPYADLGYLDSPAVPSSERVEPLGDDQRIVDGPLLTAWWAAMSIGAPGLLIGMNLAHPDGLGLSLGQIILLVPIGALVAGAIAAVVSVPGASVGVPFGLIIRPALGVGLGSLVGVLRILLYVGLVAWQFRIVLDVAQAAFSDTVGLAAVGGLIAVAAVLFVIGTDNSIRYFIRWPAFWGGIFVAFGVLWRISSFQLGFAATPGVGFWRGVDEFVWLAVLLTPLIIDSSRLIDRDSAAPTAVAFGFSVPTVLIVVGGASLAAATGLSGVNALGAFFGAGTSIVLILGLAWLLFAEVDQAFSAVYSAELEVATLTRAIPLVAAAIALLAIAGAAAAFGSLELIETVMDSGVRLLAPIVGVFLADYFAVRHARYETDDLFRLRGEYPLVNFVGLAGWLSGLAIGEWLDPVILGAFGVERDPIDAPVTLAALIAAAAIYALAGRFLVREQEYVSDVRF